jgi:3D-(3,5/4)-trihydroxycyclohexane-1,2-dione acylhydrolase (decyclizing)
VQDARAATQELLERGLASQDGEIMTQAQVVHALNQHTGRDDALVLGSGGVVEFIHKIWDTANRTEVHMEYANSCMGHEIPAGIGYRMARGDREGDVFVLIGDGTYLMQPTELVTAVQERQKVIVVLVDNHGNQCIRSLQVAKGEFEFGTQLRERNDETGRLDGRIVEVDFVANAASMGCAAFAATTVEEFDEALQKARAAGGPAVVVAEIEPHRYLSGSGAFWDVGVPMTSQREAVRKGTAQHVEDRKRQRFYAATTDPTS